MQSRLDMRTTITVLSLVVGGVTIMACGSSTTTTSSPSEDTNPTNPSKSSSGSSGSSGTSSSPSSSSSSSSSSGGTSDAGTTGDGGTQDCSTTTDADSCYQCCYEIAPADIDAADKAYDDCICAANTCATVCAASYCGSDPNATPTADCETCLNNNDATCEAKFDAACTSAACMASTACATNNCAKYDNGM